MKKICFLFAIVFTSSTFAQQDLINYFLNTKYNLKTFNIKGNVKQIKEMRGKSVGLGYISTNYYIYDFDKKGNLIRETFYENKMKDENNTIKAYTYDAKNRLTHINVKQNNTSIEKYDFAYTKKGYLSTITYYELAKNENTYYSINWKKNKPISYVIKDTNHNVLFKSSNHKFDKNNNVIKMDFNEENELGTQIMKYDKDNHMLSIEYLFNATPADNFKEEYTFNKYNDKQTKIEDGKIVKYKYSEYDKHNNWHKLDYYDYSLQTHHKREFTYY
ncbi:MAG TPA: hypothetical protein ENK67_00150 [Flavobacteriia bacterium]|nr:hypothetical protein [Flavobacteriia bacterium]